MYGHRKKNKENYTMRIILYSPNIVRVIKPKNMEWAGHIAYIRK
jgi:hypothetical protein